MPDDHGGVGAKDRKTTPLKKGIEVTDHIEPDFPKTIDRVYVINLKSRPDRRSEILSELDRIGLREKSPILKLFDAIKPETADPFRSIGAKGCFLSHLGVLRHAKDHQYSRHTS